MKTQAMRQEHIHLYVMVLVIINYTDAMVREKVCLTGQFLTEKTLIFNVRFLPWNSVFDYIYLGFDLNHLKKDGMINVAHCFDGYCFLLYNRDHYTYQQELNQISFTFGRDMPTDFDGTWQVNYRLMYMYRDDMHGSAQTKISYEEGIIGDTTISIRATIFNDTDMTGKTKNLVRVTCSFCRMPNHYLVEYLKNKQSEGSVKFDPESNSCYSSNGECLPKICHCSPTDNSFTYFFEHSDMSENKLYSCVAYFKDDNTGSIFSEISSVYINKSGLFTLPIKTEKNSIATDAATTLGIFTLPIKTEKHSIATDAATTLDSTAEPIRIHSSGTNEKSGGSLNTFLVLNCLLIAVSMTSMVDKR